MIFDSYEAFRAANFTAKVCILGSGPAGTTIARKLGAEGIPVVVLEAGSRESVSYTHLTLPTNREV